MAFSLIDMITNAIFILPKCCFFFKLACFGSKIGILRVKIHFKAIKQLQRRKNNLHFLLPALIFRL